MDNCFICFVSGNHKIPHRNEKCTERTITNVCRIQSLEFSERLPLYLIASVLFLPPENIRKLKSTFFFRCFHGVQKVNKCVKRLKREMCLMFFKLCVLQNFAYHMKAWNFLKQGLENRCFSVNIAKFLRTVLLQNISGVWF